METESHEFKFTGLWIPYEIVLNDSIPPLEKLLWSIIASLAGDETCYASNKYLANMLKVSERHIKRMISNLITLKLLKLNKFDGKHRHLKPKKLISFKQRKIKSSERGVTKMSPQTGPICHPSSQCSTIYDIIEDNPPKPPKGSVFSTTEIQDLKTQFKAIAIEESIEKFFTEKSFTNKRELKKSKKLFIELITKQNLTDYQGERACLRL